jgi:hypothetical protein
MANQNNRQSGNANARVSKAAAPANFLNCVVEKPGWLEELKNCN